MKMILRHLEFSNLSTVETLICTQSWIKSLKVINLEAKLVELEKTESCMNFYFNFLEILGYNVKSSLVMVCA